MKNVYEAAAELLRQREKGALAVLLSNEGSTPRDGGAKMLLYGDGRILESIGGGPMEYEVMQESARLIPQGCARVLRFDLSGKNVQDALSICGGCARVCVYPLRERDLPVLERICGATERGEGLQILLRQDPDTGEILLDCGEADGLPEEQVLYRERAEAKNRLFLIGGGHVCQAAARIAAVAGFEVVVVDDREEFANPRRFPDARCIVCREYDELPADWVTEHDYILIATRGHKADYVSLRWALGTKAHYVGMIGSRAKRDLEYEGLEREGVPRERLEWVHCPVGLPIGGRTPGDIAVSILAEIVDVRARSAGEGNVFTDGKRGEG